MTAVARAIAVCTHPATYAFLLPIAGSTAAEALHLEPAALVALSAVAFGSAKHFALVEICRRAYKRQAMERDRADKQAKLAKAKQEGR